MFRGNAYYRNLSILLLTVFVPLILVLIFLKNPREPLIFPKAFAMVIDDLGWMNGSSLEKENGPYRLNFNRKMRLLDYKPVVEVAKSLGIRFQGIFILCELDRENVCARYPTTTWMGSGWDNSANIDSSQIKIMQYVKDNAAFLEFGMHGIGHEYWNKGGKTRAEYYNTEDRQPWPEDTLIGHFECFRNIMNQYGWEGQSFPQSFVPTAHSYYWNPAGKYSLGSILRDYGVKYVNFKLSLAAYQGTPVSEGGGFDHGVHVIDRDKYGLQWDATNARPSADFLKFTTWPVESHWTNFLEKNDSLQPQATEAWINYLDKVQATPGLYLARNTEQLHSQWLYKKYASINRLEEGKYLIDNTKMPDMAYENELLGNLVFIVNTEQEENISHASLDGKPLLLRYKSHGKSFLYLPPLGKKQYILEIETGPGLPEVYIDYSGTYNIYNTKLSPDNLEFDIKMYGSQKIDIHCPLPDTVISNNPFLEITDYYFNVNDGILTITLSGRDMQGESGSVVVGRF